MQKHHREEGEDIHGSQIGLPDTKSLGVARGNQRELAQQQLKVVGPRLSWNRNTRQLVAISIQVITGG